MKSSPAPPPPAAPMAPRTSAIESPAGIWPMPPATDGTIKAADLGTIELHPFQGNIDHPDEPRAMPNSATFSTPSFAFPSCPLT